MLRACSVGCAGLCAWAAIGCDARPIGSTAPERERPRCFALNGCMTGTSWSGELPLSESTSHVLRFELCTNGQCASALLTFDRTGPSLWIGRLGTRELSCRSQPTPTELALECRFADPAGRVPHGQVFQITITSAARCWAAQWSAI